MPNDNTFLLKRTVSSGTINERLLIADDDDGSSISGIDNIPLSIPADVSGDVPSSETTMRSKRDAFRNLLSTHAKRCNAEEKKRAIEASVVVAATNSAESIDTNDLPMGYYEPVKIDKTFTNDIKENIQPVIMDDDVPSSGTTLRSERDSFWKLPSSHAKRFDADVKKRAEDASVSNDVAESIDTTDAVKGYIQPVMMDVCTNAHLKAYNFLPETDKKNCDSPYFLYRAKCFSCKGFILLKDESLSFPVYCCVGANGLGKGKCSVVYHNKCFASILRDKDRVLSRSSSSRKRKKIVL